MRRSRSRGPVTLLPAVRAPPGRKICPMRVSGNRRRVTGWTTGRRVLIGALALAVGTVAATRAASQAVGADERNSVTPDGTTALHQAVRQNDLATVEALIKRGANVKAATRYGITPMNLAATSGNAAILRRLLDAGADPNTATPGGETALMTAARTGSVEAVTLLLDRGAQVNGKDSVRAQTALMWAVTEKHSDVVKLLVARGADVNARTNVTIPKGEYVPARAGGASGTGIIRQRALPKADGGMTPLLFAVRDGNTAMTRLLLELGANLEQSSGNHTTPLLIALLNGQVGIATELLERGANPNAADDYHRAALFAAIDLRNFNHDRYPFMYRDGRDPLDLIKALLKKGADPNLRTDTVPVHGLMQFDASWVNFDGQTPFIRAALSGDGEVMRLLLEHGADPNIATTLGSTALMAAAGINWIPAQTYSHSEADYVEAVKLCLERGATVNATNSLGLAAIHGAANRGWVSVIQILADHGARLDVKDNAGRTPMTFAEGIFLAVRPPVAKPDAMALLKKLMGVEVAAQ
jgi:ankyrin repeat protein